MATAKVAISGVLASAFSDILGTPVVTYDQYKKDQDSGVEYEKLDISHLFRLCYESGTNQDDDETRPPSLRVSAQSGLPSLCKSTAGLSLGPIDVRVEAVNNYSYTVRVEEDDTVKKLREKLREKIGMPCDGQRLSFEGRDLDDDDRICDCGITHGSTVKMHMTTRGVAGEYRPTKFFIDDYLLDPPFDFDFTNINTEFYRGGERYYRPCGWQRFAIKVLGKYEDDKWLGEQGIRQHSSEGEWPVSYHGTKKECSDSITRQGFLLRYGTRFLHGPGIYSTPSIEVAANPSLYAAPFDHEGNKYQLVFQTRICPEGMKKIPSEKTGVGEEYWIQENENLIRPYGICLKPA